MPQPRADKTDEEAHYLPSTERSAAECTFFFLFPARPTVGRTGTGAALKRKKNIWMESEGGSQRNHPRIGGSVQKKLQIMKWDVATAQEKQITLVLCECKMIWGVCLLMEDAAMVTVIRGFVGPVTPLSCCF